MVETDIPEPAEGQMLLRTVYLSLAPFMRGRMSDAPSYAPPVEIGGVMVGGTVARVVSSKIGGFAERDWVLSFNGWQDYALSDGEGVLNLGQTPAHPSWALGVLGMPSFTAGAGLTQIGAPKSGETIVVAAATGPVGATVGQIGKILGCRVVGVAGAPINAPMRWASWVFAPASTIRPLISPSSSARRFRTASTSISRMSAARCWTR